VYRPVNVNGVNLKYLTYLPVYFANISTNKHNVASPSPTYNIPTRMVFFHQDYEYSINNLLPNIPQATMHQIHRRLSAFEQWKKLTINRKIYTRKWDGVVSPVCIVGVKKHSNQQLNYPLHYFRQIKITLTFSITLLLLISTTVTLLYTVAY
jgi:hypothetical protein